LLKILPPILITQYVALCTFLIDVEYYDTRVGTATGALLAEIFLQLSFGERLPRGIEYLSLMDLIFNVTYLLILVVILENIVVRYYFRTINQLKASKKKRKPESDSEEVHELKSHMDGDATGEFQKFEDKKSKEELALQVDQIIQRITKMDHYCFIGTCAISVLAIVICSLAYVPKS